ncbi:MAG: hypothetical protein WBA75_16150, partial [Sphingopyxis granuli]
MPKPVLSTCKAIEGPFFLLTPQEERRCFDKLSTNGTGMSRFDGNHPFSTNNRSPAKAGVHVGQR